MSEDAIILVDATLELFDAALADSPRLSDLLSAQIAQGWPGFPEALPQLRQLHTAHANEHSWGTVLFLLSEPRTLIGMGGYKGAPSAQGVVEIGYAIAPDYRNRGLATAAARALVERAFRAEPVRAVSAHTLAQSNASVRVLEKLGFVRTGEREQPEIGAVWEWRRERA